MSEVESSRRNLRNARLCILGAVAVIALNWAIDETKNEYPIFTHNEQFFISLGSIAAVVALVLAGIGAWFGKLFKVLWIGMLVFAVLVLIYAVWLSFVFEGF